MAAPSAIGAAQDALVAAIAARALMSTDNVPVTLGTPPRGGQREHVWISGEVTDWTQTWETTGAVATAAREERFTLAVWAFKMVSGDAYAPARDRALVLLNEVAEVLRADDRLAGAVFHAEYGGGELAEAQIDNAVYVVASIRVRCLAYLA